MAPAALESARERRSPFSLPPVDPAGAADVRSTSLTPELLAGLLADGDDELAAWMLGQSMDETSRAEVYDGLLRDAMRLVGERWLTGQWTIAEEHLASRTLLRTLERLRPEPARRTASARWRCSRASRASST